jgi:predicted nucleic acid-binding protein
VVYLELLYGSANQRQVKEEQAFLDQLPGLPLSRSVGEAALRAQIELAEKGAGYHRVKWPDLLIAASASERGFGVLHHDQDYDRIAEVLGFDSVWFAERDENLW